MKKMNLRKRKKMKSSDSNVSSVGTAVPAVLTPTILSRRKERVENYAPEINKASHKKEFDLFKDINDPDKVAAYNVAKKNHRSLKNWQNGMANKILIWF